MCGKYVVSSLLSTVPAYHSSTSQFLILRYEKLTCHIRHFESFLLQKMDKVYSDLLCLPIVNRGENVIFFTLNQRVEFKLLILFDLFFGVILAFI